MFGEPNIREFSVDRVTVFRGVSGQLATLAFLRILRHRSRTIIIILGMNYFFSFRADKMYNMLRDQAELLKELNQLTRVEGVSSRDGKNGEEKKQKSGLFGF